MMTKDCDTCKHALRSGKPTWIQSADKRTNIFQAGGGIICMKSFDGGIGSITIEGDRFICSSYEPSAGIEGDA